MAGDGSEKQNEGPPVEFFALFVLSTKNSTGGVIQRKRKREREREREKRLLRERESIYIYIVESIYIVDWNSYAV